MNSLTQCLRRLFNNFPLPEVCAYVGGRWQIGSFDMLRSSFGLDPDEDTFAPSVRSGAVQHWLDSGSSYGEHYRAAWEAVKARGEAVLGPQAVPIDVRNLTREDAARIRRFGGYLRPNALAGDFEDPDSEDAVGGTQLDAEEEMPESFNPFRWGDVTNLIAQRDEIKIQWSVRQALAMATWKGLERGVRELAEAAQVHRSDRRFGAFKCSDQYSRAPLMGMDSDVPFSNEVFRTYLRWHFGLPIKACATLAGKKLVIGKNKNFHIDRVDPEGWTLLTAACGGGGLRTQQHDTIQNALISIMREAGITVSGHYTINASEAASLANWQGSTAEQLQALDTQLQPEQSWFANNNLHQGANGGGGGVRCIKPDWLMRFTGYNPFRGCMSKEPRGNELVFDQKVIASVKEYAKLQVFQRQRKDQNDPSNEKGPFEHALEVRGHAIGVVSGVMGECSPSVDMIVNYVSRTVARKTKETSGTVKEESKLNSMYRQRYTLHVGSVTNRALIETVLGVARDPSAKYVAMMKTYKRRQAERIRQHLVERVDLPLYSAGYPVGPGLAGGTGGGC